MEIRTADWKREKHVPVIYCPDKIEPNKPVDITVTVGEEIPHPNTPEHHISWIELYFIPEGGKTPFLIGRAEFYSHGETSILTEPKATFTVRLPGPGTLIAISFCNLHGLWEGRKEVR